uniref:Reverse transcriptase domain-containing protein n=1 Tax=Cacopsylla melanoneura TaxID=428564 RepID=A0A8D8RZH9_9HEMI
MQPSKQNKHQWNLIKPCITSTTQIYKPIELKINDTPVTQGYLVAEHFNVFFQNIADECIKQLPSSNLSNCTLSITQTSAVAQPSNTQHTDSVNHISDISQPSNNQHTDSVTHISGISQPSNTLHTNSFTHISDISQPTNTQNTDSITHFSGISQLSNTQHTDSDTHISAIPHLSNIQSSVSEIVPQVDLTIPSNIINHTSIHFKLDQTTPKEIIDITKLLKNKTAKGEDEIPLSIIQDCIELIAEPLSFIFNNSLESGIFPHNFKNAIILPLFKKGQRYLVQNYRPISLLNTLSLTRGAPYSHEEANTLLTSLTISTRQR